MRKGFKWHLTKRIKYVAGFFQCRTGLPHPNTVVLVESPLWSALNAAEREKQEKEWENRGWSGFLQEQKSWNFIILLATFYSFYYNFIINLCRGQQAFE